MGIGLLLISSGRKTWRKEQQGRKEGQKDFWQWKVVELTCNVKLKSQRQGGLPGAWREPLFSHLRDEEESELVTRKEADAQTEGAFWCLYRKDTKNFFFCDSSVRRKTKYVENKDISKRLSKIRYTDLGRNLKMADRLVYYTLLSGPSLHAYVKSACTTWMLI